MPVSQHLNADKVPKEHHVHKPGDWLGPDARVHHEWLGKVAKHADENPKELHPTLKEFKDLIENNTRIYLLCNQMFDEIPVKAPYKNDPIGKKSQIRDHEHMLQAMNHILTRAPEWNDDSNKVGMVGTPINAILDWPMGTTSGFAFFLDPEVNACLKKILNAWGEFLASPKSAYVLGTDSQGWLSPHGKKTLESVANINKTSHSFEELFDCDVNDKHHGYKSWDDFFTRPIKESVRPVASPDDDNVIANACESKPYNVAQDVKIRDKFWIKGQPYSLLDMLSHDEYTEQFVGGTIYQAFLSALSYHRWHTPVSGKIVKQYVVDGTYYSEPLFEGLGDPSVHEITKAGEADGQGFITATATRAIIFIQADNPAIGLMCFMGIGMTEVSTCDITVKVGQHVKKGDQLGQFHFGGSSHVLLFRKGVKLEGFPQLHQEVNFPVRGHLATVVSK